jgi:hypothetical protein
VRDVARHEQHPLNGFALGRATSLVAYGVAIRVFGSRQLAPTGRWLRNGGSGDDEVKLGGEAVRWRGVVARGSAGASTASPTRRRRHLPAAQLLIHPMRLVYRSTGSQCGH